MPPKPKPRYGKEPVSGALHLKKGTLLQPTGLHPRYGAVGIGRGALSRRKTDWEWLQRKLNELKKKSGIESELIKFPKEQFFELRTQEPIPKEIAEIAKGKGIKLVKRETDGGNLYEVFTPDGMMDSMLKGKLNEIGHFTEKDEGRPELITRTPEPYIKLTRNGKQLTDIEYIDIAHKLRLMPVADKDTRTFKEKPKPKKKA